MSGASINRLDHFIITPNLEEDLPDIVIIHAGSNDITHNTINNIEAKGISKRIMQFLIFKPLSYCFEETIRFDVKASFSSRPVSRLIS